MPRLAHAKASCRQISKSAVNEPRLEKNNTQQTLCTCVGDGIMSSRAGELNYHPLIKHNLVVIASVSHFVLVFGLHSVSICFEPPLNYATHSQRTTNTPTQRSEGNAGQGVQFGWVLLCKEMNRKLCCTHRRTKTTVF